MSTATVTQEQVKEALRLKYKSLDFDRAATEQFLIARNQRSLIPLLDEIERESKTNGHSTEVAEAIAAQADEQPDNLILKAALRCVEKGWYVFALNERAKEPDKEFSPHGFNSSTNDPEVVRAIWTRKPSANYGIDLGRSNLTVLDFDNGKPPAELGLPETLQVSTSRGTHVYLSGVSKQGDMHLNGVHVGEIKSAGGYVLGPFCVHPTGAVYNATVLAPVASIPSGLIERLRPERKPVDASPSGAKIPRGHHDNELHRIAGKLRGEMGLEEEAIYDALVEICEKRCENYGSDYLDMCRKHAKNAAAKYPVNENKNLVLNQNQTMSASVATMTAELPPLDTSEAAARPLFPLWAIKGTSIYKNLVAPACATSSKFEEFIFFPAAQMMMNYLAGRVNLGLQPVNMNLFLGLISPFGEYFKSSSCSLAHQYFRRAGICAVSSTDMKNANGCVLIVQAGSPEGMGADMHKKNAKRAIMFNDELGKLVSKAGIEGSSFSSDLLSWYGSAYFGNTVKTAKSNFAFDEGTYTFGWLWCTTDRNFNRYWPKLAGMSSGIEDRMFFVVAPEKPRPPKPYSDPSVEQMILGAKETRELIDRAVAQGKFHFEEPEMFGTRVESLDPRSMDLVKKLALYFAVDLGLNVIDDDCVERARALVDYRNQAAAFLEPIEADNAEGRLFKEIIRELRQNKGKIPYRDLCLNLDYSRHGLRLWHQVYRAMLGHGEIVEFQERRTKGKRETRMVGLLKHDEDE